MTDNTADRIASHVVVDTGDGFTWEKDAAGVLFTRETAQALTREWNGRLKPQHQGRYKVYALVPAAELDDLEALAVTAGELWDQAGREDPEDVLTTRQRELLDQAAEDLEAEREGQQ